MDRWGKMRLLASILTVIGFGFVGFIVFVIAAFSRSGEFYAPFTIIVTIGLIVITILAIYEKFQKKATRMGMYIFLSLCFLSFVTYEGYQAYVRSLEIVSTQDVDLTEYQPFKEDTKAVRLSEESTLKIDSQLPKLDGATALYPVYAAFAQAVYPEKEYPFEDSEVVSTQTSGSFKNLLNGNADMIFIAEPSSSQSQSAKQLGVELTMTPVGREAFVFFVHKDNPVTELTIEEIQKIYSGEITNWKEVGGKDEEIRAFQLPEGSGSQSALIRLMNGKALMSPPSEDIVSAMGGIIEETANYQNKPNAIGFSFRFFSQEMVQNGKIKFIAVDGVEPTVENIQNGTYPIVDLFYAITGESNNPHIKAFLEWILSEQGQWIIEETGYVPL